MRGSLRGRMRGRGSKGENRLRRRRVKGNRFPIKRTCQETNKGENIEYVYIYRERE